MDNEFAASTPDIPRPTCTFPKKDGKPCQSPVVKGASRCYSHGGNGELLLRERNAQAHLQAQLKRGLAVPEHWQEEHAALCASPTLLNYTEEIASVILHLRHELSQEQVDALRLDALSRSLERLTERHEKTILSATGTLTKAESVAFLQRVRSVVFAIIEDYVPAELRHDAIARLESLRQ